MQQDTLRVWVLCTLFASVSLEVAAQVDGAAATPRQLSITTEKGLLSATILNQPLARVMGEIASLNELSIVIADGAGEGNIVADLKRVPLQEALRHLLSKYDVFYYYAADAKGLPSLRGVWVYPAGAAIHLKPVPPEAWASTGEITASLSDSDPTVRERAYEGLMTRPDRRSRDLVLKALRGFAENDEGLRQRLLSRALSNGFEVPGDVLADIARSDGSEQIRWMALDALAQDPAAVKPVAEFALTDASETVRNRAKEILAESAQR